jgi:hypothetical protein
MEKTIYAMLIVCMAYLSYLGGRHHAEIKQLQQQEAIKTAYMKCKIQEYGPKYYYFGVNGRYYYVTDKKDLENAKKWRTVK